MANGTTYGLSFPFNDSIRGDYLELTQFQKDEIKSDLLHLLLTRNRRSVTVREYLVHVLFLYF